ncbi:MAG: hypothetical protein U5L45_16390 [Saprospiraceae bacterium]|nr:hypothetical protein [Saprospiraceae bacterium]
MKRTNERRVFQNLWAVKTNNTFIKTDYHIQSFIGLAISFFLAIALICGLLMLFKLDSGNGVFSGFFSLLLLIPLGAWQVLSGVVYALNGDRLQQIYLGVVAIYFGILYTFTTFSTGNTDIFIWLMGFVAVVIAVWKYTVVRADYISLDIIAVSERAISETDVLDA